jgi:hypothetical protein
MFLRERHTFLSDQAILSPSERPLTTWKLQDNAKESSSTSPLEAVTTDASGKILGSWTVGEDTVHTQGKVTK